MIQNCWPCQRKHTFSVQPIFNSNFHEHQHLSFIPKSVFSLAGPAVFSVAIFKLSKASCPGARTLFRTAQASVLAPRAIGKFQQQTQQQHLQQDSMWQACVQCCTQLNGCAYHLAGVCAVLLSVCTPARCQMVSTPVQLSPRSTAHMPAKW